MADRVASILKERRKEMELTQSEVAHEVGIDLQSYQKFESGKRKLETVTAEGYQSPEGFVVIKGSHISPEDDDTIFPAIRTRRKEVKVDTDWVLQEDVLCRSPSFAAMLVIGKHANGLTSWKTKDGRTLKSLETT